MRNGMLPASLSRYGRCSGWRKSKLTGANKSPLLPAETHLTHTAQVQAKATKTISEHCMPYCRKLTQSCHFLVASQCPSGYIRLNSIGHGVNGREIAPPQFLGRLSHVHSKIGRNC